MDNVGQIIPIYDQYGVVSFIREYYISRLISILGNSAYLAILWQIIWRTLNYSEGILLSAIILVFLVVLFVRRCRELHYDNLLSDGCLMVIDDTEGDDIFVSRDGTVTLHITGLRAGTKMGIYIPSCDVFICSNLDIVKRRLRII